MIGLMRVATGERSDRVAGLGVCPTG